MTGFVGHTRANPTGQPWGVELASYGGVAARASGVQDSRRSELQPVSNSSAKFTYWSRLSSTEWQDLPSTYLFSKS